MKHSSCMNGTCPECGTNYPQAIDCIARESLPQCCKKYFKLIDHIHLHDKNFSDIGMIYYELDKYGNYRILLEIENWDGNIKCLCEAKQKLKEINYGTD